MINFGFHDSFKSMHKDAICRFPVRWIYSCHRSESTRKKTCKTHLCAMGEKCYTITLETLRLDIFSLFCVIIRGILNIKVLLTIPKFGLFSSFFSLLAVSWGKVGCWLGSKLFFPFFELTNHQRCVPKCLLGMFYLRSRPCHPIFVKLSDLRFLYTH